jgi:hypothetical protein
VEKIVRSGLHQAEKILAEQIANRLPATVRARLLSLVAVPADRRGLTPLFWTNIAPYGEVRLNMNNRLALRASGPEPAGDDGTGSLPATPEQ